MSTIALVANPSAGLGAADPLVARASAMLDRHGHDHVAIRPESPERTTAILEDLVASGTERVLVIGGDGTMHHVANALAGSATILGIIPGGSGNDIARSLGISTGLRAAVAQALQPATAIDLLQIGATLAVSVATLGFSVDVNRRADDLVPMLSRLRLRSQRYNMATVLEIPRLRSLGLEVTIDQCRHDIDTTLMALGNTSAFGGGMFITPDADPTDGLIDVVTIDTTSPAKFARLLPRVFSGRHVELNDVQTCRGATVRIAERLPGNGPPIEVWADGEQMGTLPIEVGVKPAALQVAGVRRFPSQAASHTASL